MRRPPLQIAQLIEVRTIRKEAVHSAEKIDTEKVNKAEVVLWDIRGLSWGFCSRMYNQVMGSFLSPLQYSMRVRTKIFFKRFLAV